MVQVPIYRKMSCFLFCGTNKERFRANVNLKAALNPVHFITNNYRDIHITYHRDPKARYVRDATSQQRLLVIDRAQKFLRNTF